MDYVTSKVIYCFISHKSAIFVKLKPVMGVQGYFIS